MKWNKSQLRTPTLAEFLKKERKNSSEGKENQWEDNRKGKKRLDMEVWNAVPVHDGCHLWKSSWSLLLYNMTSESIKELCDNKAFSWWLCLWRNLRTMTDTSEIVTGKWQPCPPNDLITAWARRCNWALCQACYLIARLILNFSWYIPRFTFSNHLCS